MRIHRFKMRKASSVMVIGLVGLLSAVVTAGVARGDGRVTPSPDGGHVAHADARAYLLDHLRDLAAGDGVWLSTRLQDQLPNHLYSIDGAEAGPISPGLVVGEVIDVAKGAGFALADPDAETRTVTDFDAPNAMWRVVEISLSVESGFGAAAGRDTVTVGLPVGGGTDPGLILEGLRGERIVVLYDEPGRFSHDRTLPAVSERAGSLIGFVDAEGAVEFPSLGEDLDGYLDDLGTAESIISAAQQPVTTTQVEIVDGIPVVQG